jgi:hypothetical protein
MKDLEHEDWWTFKKAIKRKYNYENNDDRVMSKSYRILFIGPKDRTTEEFVYDVIIRDWKNNGVFG